MRVFCIGWQTERSEYNIIIAPQGHFRRAGRYDVVGFQCVLGSGRHGVAWGNGWMSVPPATAPAFGERREMGPVGSFLSRNFGGRTAVMVRSMLQWADRHVF